jgi:hypothetical protein
MPPCTPFLPACGPGALVPRRTLPTLVLCLFAGTLLLAQAPLPLLRSDGWCAPDPPFGWTDANGPPTPENRCYTASACQGGDMGRLDANGEHYLLTLACPPDSLAFRLRKQGMAGQSNLHVESSVDGVTWATLGLYGTCSTCTPISDCAVIRLDLGPEVRHLRWTYTKDAGNVGIDEVHVTPSGTCLPLLGFLEAASLEAEGPIGTQNRLTALFLNAAPATEVRVAVWDTGNGSATAGEDHACLPDTFLFTPGGSYPDIRQFGWAVLGDSIHEADETVVLAMAPTDGAWAVQTADTIHTHTLLDDDHPGIWYRSAAPGNWSQPAQWERSDDGGLSWQAASEAPGSAHADRIHVQHALIIDQDLSADDVTIAPEGSVTIPSQRVWTIGQQGNAPQLVVEGTLSDAGSTGKGLAFQAGARWLMGPAGTVIKSGTAATATYRNFYLDQPEAPVLPPGSTFIYRSSGGSVSVSTADWTYGNLSFECTSGHCGFDQLASRINEVGGLHIQGLLDIGGSGGGTVRVTDQKALTVLDGGLLLRSGCTIENNSFDGVSPPGGRMDISGGELTILGLWRWDKGQGEIRISGPTEAMGSDTLFITQRMTLLDEAVLDGHAVVLDSLHLGTTGMAILPGDAALILRDTSADALSGGSSTGFVDGILKREMAPGTSYAFPVGAGSTYAPCTIQPLGGTAGSLGLRFTAQGQPAGPLYCPSPPGHIPWELFCGAWQSMADGAGTPFAITLSPALVQSSRYTISRDGLADPCPTGLTDTLDGYGLFSLHGAETPLPLTWLSFDAVSESDRVLLHWRTAGEVNCHRFVPEHSLDGDRFLDLGSVPAAAEPGQGAGYTFEHRDALPGLQYYRIRQEDHDGAFSYTPVRAVDHRRENRLPWTLHRSAEGGWWLLARAPARSGTRLVFYTLTGQPLGEGLFPPGEQRLRIEGPRLGPMVLMVTDDLEHATFLLH